MLTPVGDTIEPDSPTLHLSVNGGEYTTSPLSSIGGDLYVATLLVPPVALQITLQLSDWGEMRRFYELPAP